MKVVQITAAILLLSLLGASFALPASAAATTPTLSLPPATLPSYTYYVNGTSEHYTITSPDWGTLFSSVFNNKSMVSYNWSQNTTEDLIIFDLSYSGPNYFGSQFITALSTIGGPSSQNFTKAFKIVENHNSLVKSGGNTLTNLQALNAGAFPGFDWSHPRVKSLSAEYRDAGIVVAIIVATFVLYFYFNRKR